MALGWYDMHRGSRNCRRRHSAVHRTGEYQFMISEKFTLAAEAQNSHERRSASSRDISSPRYAVKVTAADKNRELGDSVWSGEHRPQVIGIVQPAFLDFLQW